MQMKSNKVKIKTWVYRPDLAKIQLDALYYKGKSKKEIDEEKKWNRFYSFQKVFNPDLY